MKKIIEAFKEGYNEGRGKPKQVGNGRVYTEAATKHRQSVEATVIRACRYCEAPGVWSTGDEIKEKWPAVWVEKTSNAIGRPVGENCPQCGYYREPNENLGEVWVREYK